MDEQNIVIFNEPITSAVTGSIVFEYGGPEITVTLNAGEGAAEWKAQLEPYFGADNVVVEGPYPIYGYWYIVTIKPGINAPNPTMVSNTLEQFAPEDIYPFLIITDDGNERSFRINVNAGEVSPIIPVKSVQNNHIHLYCPRPPDGTPEVKVANGEVIFNFFL
jgi:hypothetical protein